MELAEAWITLGRDPAKVVAKIVAAGDRDSRVLAAEAELAIAHSLAKKLMAVHHPDRNPGDLEAPERFRRVGVALKFIEDETARLRERVKRLADEVDDRGVFIDFTKT